MKPSRKENETLIHDLIAQAALEQDQGREQYSDKLVTLMEQALGRMGTPEPRQHRFNLDGLETLIQDSASHEELADERWRRLPIVVRVPDGRLLHWMTLEIETVGERTRTSDGDSMASYPAVVLTPKGDA